MVKEKKIGNSLCRKKNLRSDRRDSDGRGCVAFLTFMSDAHVIIPCFALSCPYPGFILSAVQNKNESVVCQIIHPFLDVHLKLQIFAVLLTNMAFFNSGSNARLLLTAKKIIVASKLHG